MPGHELDEKLQALKAAYIERLRRDADSISHLLQLIDGEILRPDSLLTGQRLAHGLSGSGKTFGYPAVSEAGFAADIFITAMIADSKQGSLEQLRSLFIKLRDVCLYQTETDSTEVRRDHNRDGEGYSIIIADNDAELLALLQEKFMRRGYHVEALTDGKEAWDRIFKTLPDLVILDRMMPGMDGLAVVKNMRTEPETKEIPVLVLSARKEERDIKIGMQFGATDYIKKPCEPELLLRRCAEILQSRYKDSASEKNF